MVDSLVENWDADHKPGFWTRSEMGTETKEFVDYVRDIVFECKQLGQTPGPPEGWSRLYVMEGQELSYQPYTGYISFIARKPDVCVFSEDGTFDTDVLRPIMTKLGSRSVSPPLEVYALPVPLKLSGFHVLFFLERAKVNLQYLSIPAERRLDFITSHCATYMCQFVFRRRIPFDIVDPKYVKVLRAHDGPMVDYLARR